jgi:type VI secretion system protein ImpL
LGLLGFSSVVVLLGPLFSFGGATPLASFTGQAIFIAVSVLAWAARFFFKKQKAQQAEKKMVAEIAQAPAGPAQPDLSAEELKTIKGRFDEALAVLKKARGKKGALNLYDLPWYIIIGPPGSGKTTALTHSGLRFPLSEKFGPEAIRGVGGTRNCDWWFTDDAVLIDTAGRYTTQDSNSQVDQAAWLGFLSLLKKYRKRRPINGVFVAVSAMDLLTQSEAERRAHAVAIKQRVAELDKHFGIRFPVYVLFTKCDLIAGFAEFFADLGRTEREQVWGFTFPYSDDPEASAAAKFDGEFDLLIRRLNEHLLPRVSEERDVVRRGLVHGFPKQLSDLKESFGALVKDVFQSSRYETAPLLRGVYFTSGTQEGTPIDRLMGALARTFQIDAAALPPQPGTGKSYFITDVLRKVAFAEANLAGTNMRFERQRAWAQRLVYLGSAAAAALLIAAWGFVFVQNKAYLSDVGGKVSAAAALLADADAGDPALLATLPTLDAVRALPGGYAERRAVGFRFGGLGLAQDGKIGDQAIASYRRLLRQQFLTRVMVRLETLLGRASSPEDVYEALKVYLMLDSRDHYDAAAIAQFVRADWDRNLRVSLEQRAALDAHLDALLEERPSPLPTPLDEQAVADAQMRIRSLPLEQRIYARLKREFAASIPAFNIHDAAGGPASELVFIRKSGKPLDEPVPPLFTKAGYRQVFREQSAALTAQLTSETWVLGGTGTVEESERQRLLVRVRDLYLKEFADLYSAALFDVTLAPFTTADEAARMFSVLSKPDTSPLLLLLQEVARQTALDEEPNATIAGRAVDRVTQAQERVRQILGASAVVPASLSEELARNSVEERFRDLNALVQQADGKPRPVDHLLSLLEDLYKYLSVVASESAGGAIPPHIQQSGQAVMQQINLEAAARPPLLVGELLRDAGSRTSALTTGSLRTYLNELWQSGPLTVCRQAIAERYPVSAGSERTIQLEDFGQFFGYGGAVDTFFNTHLKQYVDSTSSPWKARATGNVPIELSADALVSFENADTIKRTFFRQGSMQPSISFELRPLEMDATLSRFSLDLEGGAVRYEFGPRTPTLLTWPGPNPGTEVRLEFRDRMNATVMERVPGPWAWFQLLDRSNLTPGAQPEQFEVTFTNGGRSVYYELSARSAFNPFALPQLKRFTCPASL